MKTGDPIMRPVAEWLYCCYGRQVATAVIAGLLFALSSCATQPVPSAYHPPGLFLGMFQGFTMLFSLIGELFTHNRVYAFPNSGGWYDLGYVIGAAAFFGSSGASASQG